MNNYSMSEERFLQLAIEEGSCMISAVGAGLAQILVEPRPVSEAEVRSS
jgi:hypothetical protein